MATTNPKRHRAGSDRGAILIRRGSTALFGESDPNCVLRGIHSVEGRGSRWH